MLDSTSPIPLYHQLKAYIQGQITSGTWKPGTRLPSEAELGRQFNISRITVRLALADLANSGMLTRKQGKGTFVSLPRIQQPLMRLTGFTQDMTARSKRPGSRVLNLSMAPAPALVQQALGLNETTQVVMLRRLRLADGAPMAVETACLHFPGCERLLDEDLSSQSLYGLLLDKFEVSPAQANQQLEAAACPAEEARLLEVRKGSPVLHILRTTQDANGMPFEQVESFYRGDRYVFNVELSIEDTRRTAELTR